MFTAVYDLDVSPVSWDIVPFLVRAKMEAGPARLHVAIMPKTDGLGGFARHWGGYDAAETEWRLWNIVIPCCHLIGATVEILPERRPISGYYGTAPSHRLRPIIEASRAGHPLPKLRASDQARRYVAAALSGQPPLITATLRSVKAGDGAGETARNSNAAAWNRFYTSVCQQYPGQYKVMLLPDSGEALGALTGPFAVLSPDLRLALYEAAAMNFVGQNGPSALCWFSDAPFIQFGCGGYFAEEPSANWVKHWADMGLKTGERLPWSRWDQALIYDTDDFENIVAAFQTWRSVSQAQAA